MIDGYARVSTDGQSVDAQVCQLIRCRERGDEILREIASSYNVSAATIPRLEA